jgi:hypothetical protein
MKNIFFLAGFFLLTLASSAQLREIPKTVRENFANQYKDAKEISFKDQLTSVQVHFTEDSAKMIAKYSNKGIWKETEQEWSFEQLSSAVQDGFKKSKYADWKASEAAIIYLPGGAQQYRVKVEKNDVQKRYLFFNKDGRLLRDSITL